MLPLLVNDSEILTWGRKTFGISQGGTFSRTLLIHSLLINQHTITIKMTSTAASLAEHEFKLAS